TSPVGVVGTVRREVGRLRHRSGAALVAPAFRVAGVPATLERLAQPVGGRPSFLAGQAGGELVEDLVQEGGPVRLDQPVSLSEVAEQAATGVGQPLRAVVDAL